MHPTSHLTRLTGKAQSLRHRLSGFTLIELMIVIAIIAVLISLALPRYQSYTVRSRISEGFSLAAGAKVAVAEYFTATGQWPASNTDAGLPESISSKYVSSITISNDGSDGLITINYDTTTLPELNGANTLAIKGTNLDSSINWTCQNDSNTIPAAYLPPECR